MIERPLRAMVTCCGGRGGVNTVQSLRLFPDRQVFVLGVDANPETTDTSVVDAFEQAPLPSDPRFITRIRELVLQYRIDIVYPLAAEELIAVLKQRDRIPCIVPADIVESIRIADDKGLLYPYLRERGVEVPPSVLCLKVRELEEALYQLGYPEKKIVIKPRKASGCRGFHILDASIDPTKVFTSERPGYPSVRWEDMKGFLVDPLPELVVMEFLEGIDYTCYALVQQGEPLCSIPLRRSGLVPGMSLGGIVERNQTVIEYVARVCHAFRFHGFVNIQLMLMDGRPLVYEINPRISATTIACTAAGVNIPYLLYTLFAEDKVLVPTISWNTRVQRVYHELFYLPGEDYPVTLEEAFLHSGKADGTPA